MNIWQRQKKNNRFLNETEEKAIAKVAWPWHGLGSYSKKKKKKKERTLILFLCKWNGERGRWDFAFIVNRMNLYLEIFQET
jgi:hypothetical protein